EALQPVAQAALQRAWRVRIKCNQIPQWLAAILAEMRQRRRISVRMASHVLANRRVGMAAKALQSLCVGTRMLADEPEQIEILFGSLLGKFLQHLRLRVGAQNQSNLFVPGGVDLIQLAGARMNQFFQGTALLLRARDRQVRTLEGV